MIKGRVAKLEELIHLQREHAMSGWDDAFSGPSDIFLRSQQERVEKIKTLYAELFPKKETK